MPGVGGYSPGCLLNLAAFLLNREAGQRLALLNGVVTGRPAMSKCKSHTVSSSAHLPQDPTSRCWVLLGQQVVCFRCMPLPASILLSHAKSTLHPLIDVAVASVEFVSALAQPPSLRPVFLGNGPSQVIPLPLGQSQVVRFNFRAWHQLVVRAVFGAKQNEKFKEGQDGWLFERSTARSYADRFLLNTIPASGIQPSHRWRHAPLKAPSLPVLHSENRIKHARGWL